MGVHIGHHPSQPISNLQADKLSNQMSQFLMTKVRMKETRSGAGQTGRQMNQGGTIGPEIGAG